MERRLALLNVELRGIFEKGIERKRWNARDLAQKVGIEEFMVADWLCQPVRIPLCDLARLATELCVEYRVCLAINRISGKMSSESNRRL